MTTPSSDAKQVPVSGRKRALVRLIIALVVVGVVVAVVVLRPREFRPRDDPLAEFLAPSPVALAPGLYLLGKSSPAAVYMVETSEGLVLIDSGIEADAASVRKQIADLRFDVGQLRAILLTHVHADHSMGTAHLRELTGAKVYAGRADAEALRRGGPRDMFFSTFYMPNVTTHPTTVDVELAGDETISFGKTRFKVLGAPGHTPGSLSYLMERSDLRALFTGDVVQNLTQPRGGDMGTYAAALPPHYGGNGADYLQTLRRLRALPLPNLILPGHPRMDVRPQNPRRSESEWHALLDVGIAELETLIARHKADGANFLDGTPRELRPGLHYFGDITGHAVYCLDTGKELFLFDAPGGPELVDLVTTRFEERGWKGRRLTAVLLTSADAEATAGLAALVRRMECQVVAPAAALEDIRRLCPAGARLMTEADLSKMDWVPLRAILLGGRGVAPLAYQFRWAGKTVLVSGRIPVKPNEPTLLELERDLEGRRERVADYVEGLGRLLKVAPDVWLPAVPVHGQNANLYDREWENMLAQNRIFLRW